MFKRCYFIAFSYLFYLPTITNVGVQNMTFSQCYFSYGYTIYSNASGTFVKNLIWRNCIFSYNGAPFTVNLAGAGSVFSNNLFENCSFYSSAISSPLASSTYFRNCNIQSEVGSANNDIYDYCTFTSNLTNHFITGTSNQYGKTLATLYNGDVTQGSATAGDAVWKLKTGSAAIGWGRDYSNNATDGGAFGGADPYKLSGIPRIPSFYTLGSTAGTAATANPYPINFSVRANN